MNKPMMPNRLNKEGGKEGGRREGRAKDPWLSKVHSNWGGGGIPSTNVV